MSDTFFLFKASQPASFQRQKSASVGSEFLCVSRKTKGDAQRPNARRNWADGLYDNVHVAVCDSSHGCSHRCSHTRRKLWSRVGLIGTSQGGRYSGKNRKSRYFEIPNGKLKSYCSSQSTLARIQTDYTYAEHCLETRR